MDSICIYLVISGVYTLHYNDNPISKSVFNILTIFMEYEMKKKRKTNSSFDEVAEFLLEPFNWFLAAFYIALALLIYAFIDLK